VVNKANFAVEAGQPLVTKILGVTLFEDVDINQQLDGFENFPIGNILSIFQPLAGGVSQAGIAESISGALPRNREDRVSDDENISQDDVRKLGEIGVYSRLYDPVQDLSLNKIFLYNQRDAFQDPKIPTNYKVVTRRFQRELVTEVLEQSSKVNDLLAKAQVAIDKLQAEFKTTEAYTSEQAFLPYLETKLYTKEARIIKETLSEINVLYEKLPLLNLTPKEIENAKNAIANRFPPSNLNSETDIALKRLLIEGKTPEKAVPVEKKTEEKKPEPKVATL